ncbi:MAG: hypothetical protein ACTTJJ_02310 [Prevotella fusca]|uniref:hypothetical protein n=1 Tax=Prevotella fusca TaxID=589436 RepID=UPI003F9FFB8F
MFKNRYKRLICLLFLVLTAGKSMSQQRLTFGLETVNDSLSWLCLIPATEVETAKTGHSRKGKGMMAIAKWKLPYPVYQLATGDVNGDGKEEALVGVIKPTRFYPQPARRLFIFKQVNGKIRPMWMGSRVGGILCDFRFIKPYVRTLQATTDEKYVVADYIWDDFGLSFVRYLTKAVSYEEATERFTSDE